MAVPLLRSHPTERFDLAVPAAGARRRLLQQLPAALSGDFGRFWDIAEQFQRWLKEWSEKRDIPVMEAPQGRRDEIGPTPDFKGADPDAVVVVRETSAHHDGNRRWQNGTAGICRSPTAGSSRIHIFTSTSGGGGGCLSTSVLICRSPPASASISIIGLANLMCVTW